MTTREYKRLTKKYHKLVEEYQEMNTQNAQLLDALEAWGKKDGAMVTDLPMFEGLT